MLTSLRGLISGADDTATLLPDSEPRLVDRPVLVANGGHAVQLKLGKQALRLYPDIGATGSFAGRQPDWIIVDPDRAASQVSGFARLACGSSALIGRGNDDFNRIFDFPKSVAKRHLSLENLDGQIVIRPLDRDREAYVSAVDGSEDVERLTKRRLRNLRRVRRIFGGRIVLKPPEEALACLEEANRILGEEAYRRPDSKGRPGGLLELPSNLTPIIVGDLHAEIDNLLKILSEGSFLHALRRGGAYLLLLGDVVHREANGELEEMDSSLLMLDLICKLKGRFPKNVFHLRGNHESFEEEVSKGGVMQGLLLKEHAKALRGKKYATRLADYFDRLPYVAVTEDFIACHAGPPRFKAARKMLVEIGDHPRLRRELTWNRVRRPNRPEGYTKKDVKAFRASLGAEKHTPLIASHNRLSPDGILWTDAAGITGHHVVLSAGSDRLALFIRGPQGMIPLVHTHESLLELTNSIDP